MSEVLVGVRNLPVMPAVSVRVVGVWLTGFASGPVGPRAQVRRCAQPTRPVAEVVTLVSGWATRREGPRRGDGTEAERRAEELLTLRRVLFESGLSCECMVWVTAASAAHGERSGSVGRADEVREMMMRV